MTISLTEIVLSVVVIAFAGSVFGLVISRILANKWKPESQIGDEEVRRSKELNQRVVQAELNIFLTPQAHAQKIAKERAEQEVDGADE